MITKKTDHSSEMTRLPTAQLPFSQMATHSDRNRIFTNYIDQIRNIDVPHTEKAVTEKSVNVIKAFLRKTIAAQSYGAMFANGSYFKKLGQNIPAADSKFSFSALHHLDKISKHYLDIIIEKTPNLSEQETDLINRITNSTLTLRHQSNAGLAKNGKLNIFSNKKLLNEKIDMIGSIYIPEKDCISNDDFVFFGVEFFSEDPSQLPLNTKHTGIDFGANAYLVKDKFPYSYLTLTYHFDNMTARPSEHEHQDFVTKFPKALQEVFRYVHSDKGRIDTPIYNAKDMKLALGLHLVDFIRNSQDDALKHFALSGNLTGKELDRLINFVFQPEFHVPRMVSTTDYQAVKLREITLNQAIGSANFAELNLLVTSKEMACKAIGVAIGLRRENVVKNLLEKWHFTRADMPEIEKGCAYRDIAYFISGCRADIGMLSLFLEKGLMDVNQPFNAFYQPGYTMLDNAIEYGNTSMIALLEKHGALTSKALQQKANN